MESISFQPGVALDNCGWYKCNESVRTQRSLPQLPRRCSTVAFHCRVAQAMPCFCLKLSRCLMPHPLTTTLFTDIKALAWASRREQRQPQQPCSDSTIPVQTLAFWHLVNPGTKFVCLLRVSYTIALIAIASFGL